MNRVLGISKHAVPESAKVLASLFLWKGSLGLRNMSRARSAAHRSSWAGCLPMMRESSPDKSRFPSWMQFWSVSARYGICGQQNVRGDLASSVEP